MQMRCSIAFQFDMVLGQGNYITLDLHTDRRMYMSAPAVVKDAPTIYLSSMLSEHECVIMVVFLCGNCGGTFVSRRLVVFVASSSNFVSWFYTKIS